jgi:hypothetical protein
MRRKSRLTLAAPPPDPFGEHRRAAWCERFQLLGGRFEFETDSRRLLGIVRAAYARLPAHELDADAPHLRVKLLLNRPSGSRARRRTVRREPPPVRPAAGPGILCGAVQDASFMALSPRERSALIVVAGHVLRHAYHIRYELLEFAVYVLAARVQGLVPLHAACLGHGGDGVLLVGSSGAGKSTLVLHGVLAGLDLLAEDSVLVRPAGLLATGVASFVHVRRDSLRFLKDAERADLLRRSALIRRRSGVAKLEIDLRNAHYRLAGAPLRIRAVVFLSARSARPGSLLTSLGSAALLRRLGASQRYAANQPGWSEFCEQAARLPAYELRRGPHPREGVAALRELLAASRGRSNRTELRPPTVSGAVQPRRMRADFAEVPNNPRAPGEAVRDA